MKRNLTSVFGGLVRNNNFLKVISVFLAIFVWIYILYIVNPVNEVVFDKVEVNLAYEGSIPERNGYMYLMADPNLTVNVTVSGSRSELLNLSKEDIKATLNMDSVISEGIYNIGVSVNTGNSNLTVTEIYPKNFTIEFAEKSSRTIPVELQASGTLPTGYVLESKEISPNEVTIAGPAKIVDSISKAYLTVSLTNMKENISGLYDLSLINEAGENVDRRYLTLSEESAEALLSISYRKSMSTEVKVTNNSGSYNTNAYIKVTLDTNTLEAKGPEKTLSGIEKYTIGTIDISQITKSGDITLPVPAMEGVTFNKEQVKAHVEIAKDAAVKTIVFNTENFSVINAPSSVKSSEIDADFIPVQVRGQSSTLKKLNSTNMKCLVDLSVKNADGSYPILVTSTSETEGIPFDIVGSYSVQVTTK